MNICRDWEFYSADFSLTTHQSKPGNVTLILKGNLRDVWHLLSEDEQFNYPLYVNGHGMTLEEAVADANNKARKVAIKRPFQKFEKCVHTEHCCVEHGCKYGDDDCPVVLGTKYQSYDCESCVGWEDWQ